MFNKLRRNEKTTKKKFAFTAVLVTLVTLGIFIPIFWFNNNASPLGKYIHAQFVCEQSGLPIVDLEVNSYESGAWLETQYTDPEGKVTFGSGYPPGTYTIEWTWWDGLHSVPITIDSSSQDWYLQPYPTLLPNPEVHKTFLVLGTPVADLEATLVGYGMKTTDANGHVAWIVDYPFADTTIEWIWNGQNAYDDVLWGQFNNGVWEYTNDLAPKSGGG